VNSFQPQNEVTTIPENPFFHRGPIRSQSFLFGRTVETRRILHLLRHDQCVSITGPRRIGKTSLLFHLCNPEVQERHGLGNEYRFVYVDCQGLGDVDKCQFYQWLWQEAKVALTKPERLEGWAADEGIINFKSFRKAVTTLNERGYKLIFLLDEFETLSQNSNLHRDLFGDLRSLMPIVSYTTASMDSLPNLAYADPGVLSSPFFNVFAEMPLGFLTLNEAREMVSALLRMAKQEDLFTEQDLTFIFRIAGYHPFFLQLACYHLFEQKIEHNDRTTDYDRVQRQYAEDAKGHFQSIWKYLNKHEQEAVQAACEGQINQLDDEQKRRLERRCILYGNNFFSPVFSEIVRKQVKEIAQKSPEPKKCQLSIKCNKYGWVSVRTIGSLAYEADNGRTLEQSLIDRLGRRVIDALHLGDWRFQVKEIGRELFEDLILNRPEIANGYLQAVGQVNQAALSLVLHAPRDFLRLPFEALYNDEGKHICLKSPMYRVVTECFSKKEPVSPAIIRHVELDGSRPRALVVASNTWRSLAEQIPGVEEEAKVVSDLLREQGFDVCSLATDEATEDRVRNELKKGNYTIFHYGGHGSYHPTSPERGALYFWKGEKGKSEVNELTASQLEGLIQNTLLRFVYLSCCWGAHTAAPPSFLDNDFLGVIDGLVMGGIPAILGFRWPVSDRGAQVLAKSFYSAWLDEGNDLAAALLEARQAVADECSMDERAWYSPILVIQNSNL
jgi:hypothetical protein